MYRFNRQIYRTRKRRVAPVQEIHREEIKIAVDESLYGTGEELKQKGYDIIKCPPGYSYEKIEEFLNDNETMAYFTVDKRYYNRVSNRNFLIYGVFIKGPDYYRAEMMDLVMMERFHRDYSPSRRCQYSLGVTHDYVQDMFSSRTFKKKRN